MDDVVVELTEECPNYCGFCSSRHGSSEGNYLDKKKVKGIIDELTDFSVEQLCLSGGEPFVYEGLEEVIEYAGQNLDAELSVYTSGVTNESKRIKDSRLEELYEKGLDSLVYSFHGPDNRINVPMKGGSIEVPIPTSAHNFMMSGMGVHPEKSDKDMLGLMKETVEKAKKIGIKNSAHFVVLKPNYGQIEEAAKFCKDIGMEEISFLRYVPQGLFDEADRDSEIAKRSYGRWLLNSVEFKKVEKKLIDVYTEYESDDFKVALGDPWRTKRVREELGLDVNCKAGEKTFEITYEGDVAPCPALKWVDGVSLGNVFEKPLEEIIENGKEFSKNKKSDVSEPCMGQRVQKKIKSEVSDKIKELEKAYEKMKKCD